ncbi:hypothetical protein BKA81DRAFT_358100 [Phyllosticta paracitricarpa]
MGSHPRTAISRTSEGKCRRRRTSRPNLLLLPTSTNYLKLAIALTATQRYRIAAERQTLDRHVGGSRALDDLHLEALVDALCRRLLRLRLLLVPPAANLLTPNRMRLFPAHPQPGAPPPAPRCAARPVEPRHFGAVASMRPPQVRCRGAGHAGSADVA